MRISEPIRNLWVDVRTEADYLFHPEKKAARALRTFLRYDEREGGIRHLNRGRRGDPTSVRIKYGDHRGDQVSIGRVGKQRTGTQRIEYIRDYESGKGRTTVTVIHEPPSTQYPEGNTKVWANTDDITRRRGSSARDLRVSDEEYNEILREMDPTPLPI